MDVAGGAPYHVPSFVAHGQHAVGVRFERDDRRLVVDDVFASGIDESVRRAEVDSEIAYQGSAPFEVSFQFIDRRAVCKGSISPYDEDVAADKEESGAARERSAGPEDSEGAEKRASPEAAADDLLRSLEQEMAEAGTLPTDLESGAEGDLASSLEESAEEGEILGRFAIPGAFGMPEGEMPDDIDPRQIFAELSDLFGRLAKGEGAMSGGVDWQVVRELAVKVATQGQPEPHVEPARRIRLEELFKVAEMHVDAAMSSSAAASSSVGRRAEVVTRTEWVTKMLEDWKQMFEQLSATDPPDAGFGDPMAMLRNLMVGLSSTARMMKVGGMVGELSHTAFGCYALAVPPPEGSKRSIAIVESTLADFSREWSLDADHVGLWVCCSEILSHEVLSQPEVNSVLKHLYEAYIDEFDLAMEQEWESKMEMLDQSDDPAEMLESLFGETGEMTVEFVESEEQQEISSQVSAIASAVVGYAHHFAQKITGSIIGSSDHLAEAFRRREANNALGRQIFGIDADIDAGIAFVQELEDSDAVDRLWRDEASLPTPKELESPRLWLARMDLLD